MYSLIDLKVMGDRQGNLVAIEAGHGLSFDIKRVYYIWDTDKDALRGTHAHKKLEQLIICTSGSCDFTIDNGQERKIVHLSRPDQALYLNSPIWREFTNFSSDCVVMVLASQPYDPSDYIHDYNEFIDYISKRNALQKTLSGADKKLDAVSTHEATLRSLSSGL